MKEVKLKDGKCSISFQVLSYQLDSSKMMSPIAIAEILQEAAGTHANMEQFGYHEVFKQSMVWIINSLRFEILRMPLWEEEIIVNTWVVGNQRFISQRDFQIVTLSGEVLVNASSLWLLYNFERRRPQTIDDMGFNVTKFPDLLALKTPITPSKDTVNQEDRISYQVQYSDLDMVGHMNNTRYIRLILDSYSLDFHNRRHLTALEIQFRHEAKYQDQLELHSVEEPIQAYQHEIKRPADKASICYAKLCWATN